MKNYNGFVTGNKVKPTYAWLKKMMKISSVSNNIDFVLDELSKRRNELKLDEFSALLSYYNFAERNTGFSFRMITSDRMKMYIADWCFYLVLLQLCPEMLKDVSIYDNPLEEITTLPVIIDTDDNGIINFMMQHVFNPDSPTRQCFLLLDTRMKGCEMIYKPET